MARYSGGGFVGSPGSGNGKTLDDADKKKMGIALGVGIPCILILFAAIWYWRRKSTKKPLIPSWPGGTKKRDRMHRSKKMSRAEIREQQKREAQDSSMSDIEAGRTSQDVSPPPPAQTRQQQGLGGQDEEGTDQGTEKVGQVGSPRPAPQTYKQGLLSPEMPSSPTEETGPKGDDRNV